jgi:hypothetical protein
MTLDNINLLRTLLLLTPYFCLYLYYKKYVADSFFIKARSEVQILFMIYGTAIIFIELMSWSFIFPESKFMNFKSFENDATATGVIIGAGAAIVGWLFTTRAQCINSNKSHAFQILMESRFSDEYSKNLVLTTKLYKDTKIAENVRDPVLSWEKYENLTYEQQDSINYMLNFFEFIAVGIRCGDLDEKLLHSSLKGIINTNYEFYRIIIETKQKDHQLALSNLVHLVQRWKRIQL